MLVSIILVKYLIWVSQQICLLGAQIHNIDEFKTFQDLGDNIARRREFLGCGSQ